ncbi:MAG: type II secretion system protein GspD, partial [Armatimonadota bacterium]
VSMLPEFLLSYLRPSATDDAIIAHGPRRLLDRIEADVRVLDQPRRAVRLHATMVEASGTRARRLMWSVLRGGRPTIDLDAADGEVRIVRREQPQENLVAELRALAEREKVAVHVRPSVLVEEGRSASIFSGVTQYFQFISGGDEVTLDSTEAGVQLYVAPQVVGRELVQAYVALDISTIRGNRRPPVVDSREASATLMLASDDSMIVAGGLMDLSRTGDRDGLMPLAPEIPGRVVSSDETREIVFLIGAEVVPATATAAEDALASKGET